MITHKNQLLFQKMDRSSLNIQLEFACIDGNVEVIKYLLTSPDLKEHADIHVSHDNCFINACYYHRSSTLQYLIFEYNITQTEDINSFLITINRRDILAMFDKRKLEQQLQTTLHLKDDVHHKAKL